MKKILLLLFSISLFACSKSDDDYTNKKNQELWLKGYTQWVSGGDVESNALRFLFFLANNGEKYEVNSYPSGVTEYYDYTKLKEDATYAKLLDNGELLLKSGEVVKPIADYYVSNKDKYKEVVLPVGKYFVVAFCNERGYRRDYWNKYATTYFTLESRFNPQVLDVVIPGYYDRYGAIDWINKSDAPIKF